MQKGTRNRKIVRFRELKFDQILPKTANRWRW